MMCVAVLLLRGETFTTGRVFMGLAAYWALAWVLLGFGSLVAIQTDLSSRFALRDAAAFLYVTVLTLLLALGLGDRDGTQQTHRLLARTVFWLHALAAGLLMGMGLLQAHAQFIDVWYGPRLRGWAVNPNQLALSLVAMPFLGCYLYQRSTGLRRVVCLFGIISCVVAGIATQSDALRVAWIGSLGVVGVVLWCRAIFRGSSRWAWISHAIVPAMIVVVAVLLGDQVVNQLAQVFDRIYYEGNQGNIRLMAWRNGLAAMAESPLVGFGPGAYSGLMGPFEDFEAHNSLIDWGASTGLLGVILHVALWIWCAVRVLRSGSGALMGMLVSPLAFVMFGYLFRHVNYWTILLLVLTLSERGATYASGSLAVARGQRPPYRPPVPASSSGLT
jgi:O-antigen ligase